KWMNQTGLYNLYPANNRLVASNEVKSGIFNGSFGYEELRFSSQIFYVNARHNIGFLYANDSDEVLSCIDLASGITRWTATVPRQEEWVDLQELNDSVLLVAAAGLHAINVKRGLLWSAPMKTAVPNRGKQIYSAAKYNTVQKIGKIGRAHV